MYRRVERGVTTVIDHHQGDDAAIVFEEYLLRRAARDRLEAEQRLSDAIAMAVDAGFDRNFIGRILGVMPKGGAEHLDQAS